MYKGAENLARKMVASAVDGSVVVDGVEYTLRFDYMRWVYVVTDGDTHVVTLNDKKLRDAKNALRKWLID